MNGAIKWLNSLVTGISNLYVEVSRENPLPVQTPGFTPVGAHIDGTVISAATVLAPPVGATKIFIQATVQNIRYTLDGTDPTATRGFLLKAGDQGIILDVGVGVILKVIEETATADLQAQWGM